MDLETIVNRIMWSLPAVAAALMIAEAVRSFREPHRPDGDMAARDDFLSRVEACRMVILHGRIVIVGACIVFVERFLMFLFNSVPFHFVTWAQLAGAAAFGFVTVRLAQARVARPVGFPCGECGKVIFSDRSWICGYCDSTNQPAKDWSASVLNQCGDPRCRKAARAMSCPHCGGLVTLSPEADLDHLARFADAAAPASGGHTTRERERADREHEIAMLRLGKDLLKLKGEVGMILENETTGSWHSEIEKLVASCEGDIEQKIRLRKWRREKYQAIASRGDLDPDDKEKLQDAIDEAVFQAEQREYRVQRNGRRK